MPAVLDGARALPPTGRLGAGGSRSGALASTVSLHALRFPRTPTDDVSGSPPALARRRASGPRAHPRPARLGSENRSAGAPGRRIPAAGSRAPALFGRASKARSSEALALRKRRNPRILIENHLSYRSGIFSSAIDSPSAARRRVCPCMMTTCPSSRARLADWRRSIASGGRQESRSGLLDYALASG